MRLRRRPPLDCRHAVELVTAYLDDALSSGDRRRLEHHLAQCPHCAEYLAQIKTVVAVSGQVPVEALSPQAQHDLVDLFHQWRDTGRP